MSAFGVHSEVGKLRRVMVHRPELSLQRLTPTNHDELLFDDVLWVERAQYEHDQFVAKIRERGVEVFILRELLSEALAASEEGRRRLIELAVSEYTVGTSLVDEVRAVLWALKPEDLARHLIGGMTVAEADIDLDKLGGSSLGAAALDDTSAFILPPLPNTLFTATPPAGCMGACRSTRCTGRRDVSRPTTSPPSTATTRCSPTPISSTGIRNWVTMGVSRRPTSGGPRSRAVMCSRSGTGRY